jgi:zinc protease
MEEKNMKRLSFMAVVLVIALAASALEAGPKKVTLPSYEHYTLENGLEVCVMETSELPLVTMRLLIPVGSAHDISGREGIANLTARMLMKGAAGRTAEEISESIEDMGGTLEAEATRDYTLVTGDFMSRDLEKALGIISNVVLRPDFPGEEHEREKSIVSAEIRSAKERSYYYATRQFIWSLGGDHPYAHPVDGSEKSIASIARQDIVDFHEENYGPAGAILAVVGDVDAKKTMKMVKKQLGGWKGASVRSKVPKLAEKRYSGRKIIVVDKPDATQSQIRIGNIAVGRDTPYYFQLRVANTILGGGFTSRLMKEIRVVRGLSYGARSILRQLKEGGVFYVFTYTKNETLREALDVALEELEKLRTVAVDAEELESSERYISGLFPFQLETNSQLARWLTELSFYGLGKEFVENYRSDIDAVTSEEVQEVARKYFHLDDCMILLITNYEEVKGQLEGLGKIDVVEMSALE